MASNLNWSAAGTTIPNLVTVEVGTRGSIIFRNTSPGATQVVADVAGRSATQSSTLAHTRF